MKQGRRLSSYVGRSSAVPEATSDLLPGHSECSHIAMRDADQNPVHNDDVRGSVNLSDDPHPMSEYSGPNFTRRSMGTLISNADQCEYSR
jgi:hypothetical protein